MTKRSQSVASGKPKINKSQAIREYKKANPRHKPAKIAAALGEQGIEVSAQFVSTILSTSKKKKIGKPGRPKGTTKTRRQPTGSQPAGDEVSFDSLLKVKQIVVEMGGLAQARAALAALERLMS